MKAESDPGQGADLRAEEDGNNEDAEEENQDHKRHFVWAKLKK